MKILFFSDLHAHAHEQFSRRLETGRNSRLQDCLDIIQQVKDLLVSRRDIQAVIFCGDLFHARNKLDVDVFTSVYAQIKGLRNVCDSLGIYEPILLTGNHDQYTRIGEVHSLQPFREIARVIDEPTALSLVHRDTAIGDEVVKIKLYPHTSDVATLKQRIAAQENFHIMVIHQAVKEGRLGPGDITLAEVPLSTADLRLDELKYCFAGDYHKRQWIGNFHYIGSPLQLTFGERDETKAFTILDTQTWTCEEVHTQAPRFFIFNTLADYEQAKISRDYSKDFVRIEAKSSAEVDKIKSEHPEVQVILSKNETELARVSKDALTEDRMLLEAYVGGDKLYEDPTALVSLGMSYLTGEE